MTIMDLLCYVIVAALSVGFMGAGVSMFIFAMIDRRKICASDLTDEPESEA